MAASRFGSIFRHGWENQHASTRRQHPFQVSMWRVLSIRREEVRRKLFTELSPWAVALLIGTLATGD
jgi:hypothetical protein